LQPKRSILNLCVRFGTSSKPRSANTKQALPFARFFLQIIRAFLETSVLNSYVIFATSPQVQAVYKIRTYAILVFFALSSLKNFSKCSFTLSKLRFFAIFCLEIIKKSFTCVSPENDHVGFYALPYPKNWRKHRH
jgi:hypothetical protein